MAAFGFGVGDFLAGAELAYKLGKALSDSGGASQSYRELMAELNVIHKVLLQVDQLRAANQLAKPTINALLFAVNSANESMRRFIEQNDRFHESLKSGGSGNVFKDTFYKGKWTIQMPEKTRDLRMSLASTLAAINALVSLACYQNHPDSDGLPDYSIRLEPSFSSIASWQENLWADIKLHGSIRRHGSDRIQDPDFTLPQDPKSFFRPGQIFSTPITSTFEVSAYAKKRNDEVLPGSLIIGNSPLGPVKIVDATSPEQDLEDRRERLRQIQNLPLDQMTLYCVSADSQPGKVSCLLCDNDKASSPSAGHFTKEEWASFHFRVAHWNYYLSILPRSITSNLVGTRIYDYLIPQDMMQKPSAGLEFSSADWIVIEDIASHLPMLTDEEVIRVLNDSSIPPRHRFANHRLFIPRELRQMNDAEFRFSPRLATIDGPVLIRRFLVVREGKEKCLCLGIHTYAGKGSADQSDQHLFAIIHPGKSAPQPLSTEPNIILSPIRMKPDHPSTALPQSARIHFGRVYEVEHRVRVQALGLVHPTSMETLETQFEANVERMDENDEALSSKGGEEGQGESPVPSAADEK